jgi:hypothetical protein
MSAIISSLSDKIYCPFLFYPGFAKVISGTEEAAGAWIGINQYLGVDLHRPGYDYALGNTSINSYGIVDMSQSSLQVSLFLSNQSSTVLDNLYPVNLGAQSIWDLYATSYLDLGYVTALDMYRYRGLQRL